MPHKDPEARRKYFREWRKRNKDRQNDLARKSFVKCKYGLSWDEYLTAMNEAISCEICEREFSESVKIHVDHNHATGRFRGILCSNCNTAIGLFSDDQERLRRAIAYISQG